MSNGVSYCMRIQHHVCVKRIIIHACVKGGNSGILEWIAHTRMFPHPIAKLKYLGLV